MIIESIFHALVFNLMLIRDEDIAIASGAGLVFPAPEESRSLLCNEYYIAASVGWSRCPAGYAVFVRVVPFVRGARIVLFGLKVKPHCTVSGKTAERSVWLEPIEVERYLTGVIETAQSILGSFSHVMNASIHEIRSINRDITAAAQEIMDNVEFGLVDKELVGSQSHGIRSLSEILATRSDFLEYLSSTGRHSMPRTRVRPYGKFDKVRKSLEPRARSRSISVSMLGSSFAEIIALDVFEVIPYLIIQNAIKYSPDSERVSISVSETDRTIDVQVVNLGPSLDADEARSIFELGYRGRVAERAVGTGWGMGMAFLKDLVELHHHGNIKFNQDPTVRMVNGFPYARTTVNVSFPRAPESNRGERHGR